MTRGRCPLSIFCSRMVNENSLSQPTLSLSLNPTSEASIPKRRPVEEVFSKFVDEAIGAASIGQVDFFFFVITLKPRVE